MPVLSVKIKGEINENFASLCEGFVARLANEFYDALVSNIRSNKYGFSNKPSTIKRKHSAIPMIDSGEYISKISVEKGKVLIQEGTHTITGISFGELSDLLEYGRRDKGFMGYPVWRKTLEDMRPYFMKEWEKFVQANLFE